MEKYDNILNDEYFKIETSRRKAVKDEYISLYNLIMQIGEHTKSEISNFNSSLYSNPEDAYSALLKLKNNYRIYEYIRDKYDYHHIDFSYSQSVKLKELYSLYNNGTFMEEKKFNIFRYNKWCTTPEAEKIDNNFTKKTVHIWLVSLFGPILFPSILGIIFHTFQSGSLIEGFIDCIGDFFGFFFLSAFVSPILLPIEISTAYFFCKKLKDKHYDLLEEEFDITFDRTDNKALASAVALATKTHISLGNELKRGGWIEKK